MRNVLSFLLFFTSVFAQEKKEVESNKFAHYIGINTYTMNFDFYASKFLEFTKFGGNELNYFFEFKKDGQNTYYLKSGVFFYKAKSQDPLPDLNYWYFPFGIGTCHSFKKKENLSLDFNLSTPLLSYEGSKNMRRDKLWLNYEEAINYSNEMKNRTVMIEQLLLGLKLKNKWTIEFGEIGYFTSIKGQNMPIFTPGFLLGVKYKVAG